MCPATVHSASISQRTWCSSSSPSAVVLVHIALQHSAPGLLACISTRASHRPSWPAVTVLDCSVPHMHVVEGRWQHRLAAPSKTDCCQDGLPVQDPVIFSGSVRANLDPFDVAGGDVYIWEALKQAGMAETIQAMVSTHRSAQDCTTLRCVAYSRSLAGCGCDYFPLTLSLWHGS